MARFFPTRAAIQIGRRGGVQRTGDIDSFALGHAYRPSPRIALARLGLLDGIHPPGVVQRPLLPIAQHLICHRDHPKPLGISPPVGVREQAELAVGALDFAIGGSVVDA